MGKVIKIILSAISVIILLLIIVPVVTSLLLSVEPIQNVVSRAAAEWLGEKTATTVTIDRMRLRLFNRVAMEGLYIEDYNGDTLLYAGRITAPVKSFSPGGGAIKLGVVELDEAVFKVVQDSSSGVTGVRQFINRLNGGKPKPKKRKPLRIDADGCRVRRMEFERRKLAYRPVYHGVNFTDIAVSDFSMDASNVKVTGDSIRVNIDRLSLREKGGLVIDDFRAEDVIISPSGIYLKDVHIGTPESQVGMTYLSLRSGTWRGYRNSMDDVIFSADVVNSTVGFSTISCFARSLNDRETVLTDVNCTVEGPVSALEGVVTNAAFRGTTLSTGFRFDGLPDMDNARFRLDGLKVATEGGDVDFIAGNMFSVGLPENISKWAARMGGIAFNGDFDGSLKDFTAAGALATTQGVVDLRLAAGGAAGFTCKLTTEDFDLGRLLEMPEVGRITVDANVSGNFGAAPRLSGKVNVPAVRYGGYTYRNIAIDGSFDGQDFNGRVNSSDTNLDLDFDGLISFADTLPSYNFDLIVRNFDLHKTGFDKRGTTSLIRGSLSAEGSGIRLDEMNARATIGGMTYINDLDTVRTGRIDLTAVNSPNSKMLGMSSSFADLEFRGRLGYSDLFSYLQNTLREYLPSLKMRREGGAAGTVGGGVAPGSVAAGDGVAAGDAADADHYYTLTANIKEANNVAGIFIPQLELAEGTRLNIMFNPQSDLFSLSFDSEYIQRGEQFFVSGLNVASRNQADSISIFARADDLFAGGFYMPNFSVQGGARNNRINLATRFDNPERGTSAMISTSSQVEQNAESGEGELRIGVNPSYIHSDGQTWMIAARDVVYGSSKLRIDRFSVSSGEQSISVNGTASHSRADTLRVRLNNFDLSPVSNITSRRTYDLRGTTNGFADIASAFGEGVLYANIRFDSVEVNGVALPDTRFESNWDFQQEHAAFSLADRNSRERFVTGFFRPNERRLYADMRFDSLRLSLIDPLLQGSISETGGTANARMVLTNPEGKLRLDGKVQLNGFRTKVDYTNVAYTIPEAVMDVTGSVMSMGPVNIYDPEGRASEAEFMLDFSNLRNLVYDLRVRPDDLRVLATTIEDNDLFYGNVNASGTVRIHGNRNDVGIDVTATTTGQSSFFMPLGDEANISRADFIVFGSPERQTTESLGGASRRRQLLMSRREGRARARSRLNVNMQLDVRPNAEVQLVVDPLSGDIIKGRGNGSLNFHVNPSNGDFTIYGDYDITEGSYHFTLRNIVSRVFAIEPGSSIQWSGDPLDARLNVTGVYRLKASLEPLIPSGTGVRRSSTNVECILRMTDNLTNPTITFDIQVPNATPEVQSLVSHALNTQEMIATQVLWLLAAKTFYTDDSGQSLNIGSVGATATGVDFVANQISRLMSSERFSFVPKYNMRNEISSSEVGGSIYGEIVKDRLILDMDLLYDTGDTPTRTAHTVMGDATLSLLLDDTGDLRLQAFTRTIDRFDEYQGMRENGIGVFYRENFDNLRDLRNVLRQRFSRIDRRDRKAAREQMREEGAGHMIEVEIEPGEE